MNPKKTPASYVVLVACGFFLGLGAVVVSAASPRDSLIAARAAFEEEMKNIDQAYREKKEAWRNDYLARLQACETRMQKEGNETAWMAVKKEIRRFLAEETLLAALASNSIAPLNVIQNEALAELAKLEEEQRKLEAAQIWRYRRQLDSLAGQMDKESDKDTQREYRAERDRISAMMDARRADFASFQIRETNAVPTSAPGAAVTDTSPQGTPDKPHDGVIYTSAEEARIPSTLQFKTLSLTRTSYSPLNPGVRVTVGYASEAESGKGETFGPAVETHYVRLTLRTVPALGTVSNVLVQVQYFARQTGRQKIIPEQVAVKRVAIDELGTTPVIVDMTPVTLTVSRPHPAGGYGREFYGVIVSVFDSHQRLLSQGYSARALEDLATQQPLGKSREELILTARQRYEAVRAEYIRARDAYLSAVDDEKLKDAFKAASRAHEAALKAFAAELAKLTNAPPVSAGRP